jgi:hypothetical protein
MLEHQIRCAIYARKGLKPGSKLALLGVLACVNWQTWSGPCSSQDVAKRMGMDARTVRRAFKNLVELNLIRRVAERRETANGKGHHHRAQTTLNVKLIMSGVTLGQNDLTPLGQNDLTPLAHSEPPLGQFDLTPLGQNDLTLGQNDLTPLGQDDLTPLGQNDLHINHGYSTEDINHKTTEDTQQTSQPVQSDQPSVAVVAVEVNDEIPPELSDLTEYQMSIVREHAADHKCSLLEANAHFERIRRNTEKKLEWRRKNESKMNRPTTAYRPKPLY